MPDRTNRLTFLLAVIVCQILALTGCEVILVIIPTAIFFTFYLKPSLTFESKNNIAKLTFLSADLNWRSTTNKHNQTNKQLNLINVDFFPLLIYKYVRINTWWCKFFNWVPSNYWRRRWCNEMMETTMKKMWYLFYVSYISAWPGQTR